MRFPVLPDSRARPERTELRPTFSSSPILPARGNLKKVDHHVPHQLSVILIMTFVIMARYTGGPSGSGAREMRRFGEQEASRERGI